MSGTAGPTERRPIVTRRSRNGRDRVCDGSRSEEHTSELQSQSNLVCRLLLEKKKKLSTQDSISRSDKFLPVDNQGQPLHATRYLYSGVSLDEQVDRKSYIYLSSNDVRLKLLI